jgi:hypothetical protein
LRLQRLWLVTNIIELEQEVWVIVIVSRTDSGGQRGFPIEAFEDPSPNRGYSRTPLVIAGIDQEK